MKEPYNYLNAMKSDIIEYINDNGIFDDYLDEDGTARLSLAKLGEIEQGLYNDLWNNDSVTGNESGSYFFNSEKSKECVLQNMETLVEAFQEFDITPSLGHSIANGEWEYMDVTIRCYLLRDAIHDVIHEWLTNH